MLIASDDRRIVTCIAEMEQSCDEIQLTNEHGDKHAVVVLLGKIIVKLCGNGCRHEVLLGQSTKQTDGLSHE